MKTKKRTRLTRFLFGFLPLLLLASCVKENEYIPTAGGNGESMVKFAVQSPGAAAPQTRSITEAQENDVQTIDILVFQQAADGGNYVYTARCDASDITTGSDARLKTFTIKLRQGNFDLVIIANARDLFIPSALSGLSKADALATLEAVMPTGDKWPADGSAPFPMWGDVGAITIDDNTDLTGTNKVKINRMVARVDVNITGTAATNFQLTSVDVYNYNTAGTLVPDMTAWDTTDPDKPYATAPNVPASSVLTLGPLVYDGTEINTVLNNCVREIYLFEAENHTDATHTTAKGLQDRTCLVIGGIWDANGDGDFTNDGPATYYRVDFSTGTGTAQTFIDVNRNHQYVFNVSKVSGYGYDDSQTAFISGPINIESEVVTWNDFEIEEMKDDGQYYIGISHKSFEFGKNSKAAVTTKVVTDYPTGWTYTITDSPSAGGNTSTWCSFVSCTNNGAGIKDDFVFSLTENTDGSERYAYIHFTAGRMTMVVEVTQTMQDELSLSLLPSGEWTFNSGLVTGLDITELTISATWEPTDEPVYVTYTPLTGTGVPLTSSSATFPLTLPGGSGSGSFTIKPEAMKVAASEPYELISRLDFSVTSGSQVLNQSFFVRQKNYGLKVSGNAASYYMDGTTTRSFTVISNTRWEATITNGAGVELVTTSGEGLTSGEAFDFVMTVGTASSITSSTDITFTSPDGLFDPVTITIGGHWGYVYGNYLLYPTDLTPSSTAPLTTCASLGDGGWVTPTTTVLTGLLTRYNTSIATATQYGFYAYDTWYKVGYLASESRTISGIVCYNAVVKAGVVTKPWSYYVNEGYTNVTAHIRVLGSQHTIVFVRDMTTMEGSMPGTVRVRCVRPL